MADPSNNYPKETKKVISSGPGITIGKGLKKKKKSGIRAGSYNKRARKDYEKMLADAGKI
jgi:hypothetical protein